MHMHLKCRHKLLCNRFVLQSYARTTCTHVRRRNLHKSAAQIYSRTSESHPRRQVTRTKAHHTKAHRMRSQEFHCVETHQSFLWITLAVHDDDEVPNDEEQDQRNDDVPDDGEQDQRNDDVERHIQANPCPHGGIDPKLRTRRRACGQNHTHDRGVQSAGTQ